MMLVLRRGLYYPHNINHLCFVTVLSCLKSYPVASLQVHLQVHFEDIEVHLARLPSNAIDSQ